MSSGDGSNTDEVVREIFRAMNTSLEDRKGANILRWAGARPPR